MSDRAVITRIFRDGGVYAIGQAVVLGLPVLLVPIFTRLLEPAEFGTLEILSTAGILTNFIVGLEISQGLARHYLEERRPEFRRNFASTALLFLCACYALFLGLLAFTGGPLTRILLRSDTSENLVLFAALATIGGGLFSFFQNQLRWRMRPVAFAAAGLLYAALSVALSLLLVVGWSWGVKGVLTGQAAAALIAILVPWWLTRDDWGLEFSLDRCRAMLRYSIPLVLSSASIFLLGFSDRFIIQRLLGAEAVGLYGVGFRLASVASIVLVGLNSALVPMIYQQYGCADTPRRLAAICRIFLAVTIPLYLLGSALAPELVTWIAGPKYAAAWTLVSWLGAAAIFGRMYLFAPGMDLAKKTGWIAAVNFSTATFNICLCYVLVTRAGVQGAAVAAAASSLLGFMAYLKLSHRFYPVPYDVPLIAGVLAGCAVLVALTAQLDSLWMRLLITGGGASVVYRLLTAPKSSAALQPPVQPLPLS